MNQEKIEKIVKSEGSLVTERRISENLITEKGEKE